MSDVECPYCGAEQEINHDDGYGYDEDVQHKQECRDCGKMFSYTTSVLFMYSAKKADCLNGSPHDYRHTITFPRRYTKMRCYGCDDERPCTDEEMARVLAND